MIKTQFIWLDGNLIPWDEAKIPVGSHTLHYGSGAFEGIRLYKTKIGSALFRFHEHLERLLYSFSLFKLQLPVTIEMLKIAIEETIKINNLQEAYIRPILFCGNETIHINPQVTTPHAAIIVLGIPKEQKIKNKRLMISQWQRISSHAFAVDRKISGHYVNSIIALQEAQDAGYDDALLLDDSGMIAECSGANIFFIINDCLVTPSLGSILPGITRKTVIQLAHDNNISIQERSILPDEIQHASEAFITGTMAEIMPIASINKIIFNSPGPLTTKLSTLFSSIVKETPDLYKQWFHIISHDEKG